MIRDAIPIPKSQLVIICNNLFIPVLKVHLYFVSIVPNNDISSHLYFVQLMINLLQTINYCLNQHLLNAFHNETES